MTRPAPRRPLAGPLARFLQSSLGSRSVAAAAGIVAFGFVGSRLLGLLRQIVIARAFGTEPELAAYFVAFRLPDLVFQLLAGATLAAAFIPTFSRVRLRGGEEEAWRLASSVLNLVAIATGVLAAVAFVLAPLIVPWLAPGLGEETGRQEELRALAVQLTRIMLVSPLLFGVSGMLTGILNARQHFAAPALAPMFYNASIILAALFLAEPMGVRGLALGVVLGAAAHLLVQLPALSAVGMRWAPSLDFASEGVREVARLMGPRVVGLAAAQVNFAVLVFFASFVSDEAISAVNYAFLMAMLPVGVVGMAISTAVFPTMAAQAAAQQLDTLRASLASSLRVIVFLSAPAALGLLLLAQPAVVLLLQRGAFDAASSAVVVLALRWFALGIAASAAIEILSRGFYALADTRTPVAVAVFAMVLNVVLAGAFVSPFGVSGLAAAASVAAILECLVLWVALQRRLGGIGLAEVGRSLTRTAAAVVLMAEVVLLLLAALEVAGVHQGTAGGALVAAVVAGASGLVVFVGVSAVTGNDAYRSLVGRLGS